MHENFTSCDPTRRDWQSRRDLSIILRTHMANVFYRDRLIVAFANLNPSNKEWSPGAEITWKSEGQRHSHTIGGLTDRFKTSDDAERFVVNLAKTWIDANP
jgi:hypothetical protein